MMLTASKKLISVEWPLHRVAALPSVDLKLKTRLLDATLVPCLIPECTGGCSRSELQLVSVQAGICGPPLSGLR